MTGFKPTAHPALAQAANAPRHAEPDRKLQGPQAEAGPSRPWSPRQVDEAAHASIAKRQRLVFEQRQAPSQQADPLPMFGKFEICERLPENSQVLLTKANPPATWNSMDHWEDLTYGVDEGYPDLAFREAADFAFSYYEHNSMAKWLNDGLRSGDVDKLPNDEDLADCDAHREDMTVRHWVQSIAPAAVELPEGAVFTRLLGKQTFGGEPLDSAGFRAMKSQLIQASPGTVIRELGLMSTSPGEIPHGEFKSHEIQFKFVASQGAKAVPVIESGELFDAIFLPGQRIAIQSCEWATPGDGESRLNVSAVLLPFDEAYLAALCREQATAPG